MLEIESLGRIGEVGREARLNSVLIRIFFTRIWQATKGSTLLDSKLTSRFIRRDLRPPRAREFFGLRNLQTRLLQ